MPDSNLPGDNQGNLVEQPIIDRLGLSEAHFHGVYTAAMERLASGDVDSAFRDLANLVLMAPMSMQFQLGLAQAALRAEVPELALQAAAAVIALAPNRPEGYLLSGQACLAMNERALAREDLADAIAKADAHPRYAAVGRMARQALVMAEGA